MKLFLATSNYVVKGIVRENLKKIYPGVEVFDVLNDEDFMYHLECKDEIIFLIEKFFLGLCIQEKLTCLKAVNKNIRFVFFETGEVCAEFFGLRVYKLGAAGFISNADNKELLIRALKKILSWETYFPEDVDKGIKSGVHLHSRAVGELTDSEFSIAVLLATGMSPKEIAFEMSLSDKGVYSHIYWLRRKIGWHNPEDYAEVYKQMLARDMGGWIGCKN